MHLLIENNLIDKELYNLRLIKILFCIFFSSLMQVFS